MSTLSEWTMAIEEISAKSAAERAERVERFKIETERKDFSKFTNEDLLTLFVRAVNGMSCFYRDERAVWEAAHHKIQSELLRRMGAQSAVAVDGDAQTRVRHKKRGFDDGRFEVEDSAEEIEGTKE